MPTLADGLGDWYDTGAAFAPPTNFAELVDQLGGRGRGGGTRAAAEMLGTNPQTGRPYTARAVERYLHQRGEINPRTGREYQYRPLTPQIEARFNAAVGRLTRTGGGDVHVTVDGPLLTVGDDYEEERPRRAPVRTLTPLTQDQLRPILANLAAGRRDEAAAAFGELVIQSYGIPVGGEIRALDRLSIVPA